MITLSDLILRTTALDQMDLEFIENQRTKNGYEDFLLQLVETFKGLT